MSNEFILEAEAREDQGKGASRRLRRAGLVPGIIYGSDKEPVAVSVNANELNKKLANEAFYSHILEVKVGKKKEKGLLKALHRHPAKPIILHFDILRVDAKHEIRVNVPLHFINEDVCVGVKAGGRVSHNVNEVEITCLPKDLPEYIEVDLAAVELGSIVHLTDIQLPKGVALTAFSHGDEEAHDLPIASVAVPTVAAEPEDDAPAAEGEAEGATEE